MTRKAAAGRGTIGQRSDKLWRGSVMVDGRRRYVHAKTQAEVIAKLDALRATLSAGIDTPGDRLTVARFLGDWLVSVKPTLRPATWAGYAGHVRLYITPAIGSRPLVKLTPAQVQTMLAGLEERGLSPQTVRHVRATLRHALGQAEDWQMVTRNVAKLTKPPRLPRRNMVPMTEEQARAFLAATRDTRDWPLYVVALTTGARQGELLGLPWSAVDLDTGTVTVSQALQRVDGALRIVEPKSESSSRTIVLSQLAVAALREQRQQQRYDRLDAGPAWAGERWQLVFADAWGEPLRNYAVTQRFQRDLAAAGLPRFRFHDLRHTAATLLLSRGVPPRVVMETLGHSTITVTLNIYAHVMPNQQRDAADRMDEALAAI